MATEVASPNIAKIHLTEHAAKKIRMLLEKEGVSLEQGGLRVGVQGGGCSASPMPCALTPRHVTATRFSKSMARASFVDPKSFLYLNGTTLEYEETLMRQGFVFQNPNAARTAAAAAPSRPKWHRL